MILLLAISDKLLAFIILFCGAIGFIAGVCFMEWGKMADQAREEADPINLDEYETFEDKRYEWRKETPINN